MIFSSSVDKKLSSNKIKNFAKNEKLLKRDFLPKAQACGFRLTDIAKFTTL